MFIIQIFLKEIGISEVGSGISEGGNATNVIGCSE
jgi:hypothetical protein